MSRQRPASMSPKTCRQRKGCLPIRPGISVGKCLDCLRSPRSCDSRPPVQIPSMFRFARGGEGRRVRGIVHAFAFVPLCHPHEECRMLLVTTLGFPRIGQKRELKVALERYWRGESSAVYLRATAKTLRCRHWELQRSAGADVVPVNDFSLYDHVLDTAWLFGAMPQRYLDVAARDPLAGYFASARGMQTPGVDLHALEMTKWFDTNYHYLVPELQRNQKFELL